MALSEYRINGQTYKLEDHDVPEGAELIREDALARSPWLFPGDKPARVEKVEEPPAEKPKRARKANKQAPAPENKQADPDADKADESND